MIGKFICIALFKKMLQSALKFHINKKNNLLQMSNNKENKKYQRNKNNKVINKSNK